MSQGILYAQRKLCAVALISLVFYYLLGCDKEIPFLAVQVSGRVADPFSSHAIRKPSLTTMCPSDDFFGNGLVYIDFLFRFRF